MLTITTVLYAGSVYHVLFERSEFLIDTWYIPKKTSARRACVRLILALEGSLKRYCCRTYYVPDTYVPGISRQK